MAAKKDEVKLRMNSDDIYVMPMFVTLQVFDLPASTRWYQKVLGFSVLFQMPGQLVHLRREKFQDVLLKPSLAPKAESRDPANGVSLCFSVGNLADINRLSKQVVYQDATVIEGPVDRPWNVRELVLEDPDGYCISLSAGPIDHRSFDEILPSS